MKQKLCKITATLLALGLIAVPSSAFATAQPITGPIPYSDSKLVLEKDTTPQPPLPTALELPPIPPAPAKTTQATLTEVSSDLTRSTNTFRDIFPDVAFADAVASNLGKVSTDTVTQTELDRIDCLYANNQGISSIKGIGQLSNLWVLDLNNNQLTTLPAEIGQLSNLDYLNLNDNQLTTLPAEIGQLSIYELYLSNNQLTALPAEFGQLSNLAHLNLNNNKLTNLFAEIGQLSNLQQLDLDHNQLTALPAEIGQLSNLYWLTLRNNQLTDLPIEFEHVGKNYPYYYYSYYFNDFSYNKFSKIPQALLNRASNDTSGYANNYISFMGNQFTEITDDVLRFNNIILADNQITKIAPNVLQKLSNTQQLGTPFGIWFPKQTAQTETKTIAKGQTITSQNIFPSIILQLNNVYDFVQNDIPVYLTITQGNYKTIYSVTDIMQHGLNADQAFPQAGTYQAQVKTYSKNSLNLNLPYWSESWPNYPYYPGFAASMSGEDNTALHTYTYEVLATGGTQTPIDPIDPNKNNVEVNVSEIGQSVRGTYQVLVSGTVQGAYADGVHELKEAEHTLKVTAISNQSGAFQTLNPSDGKVIFITVKNGKIAKINIKGLAYIAGQGTDFIDMTIDYTTTPPPTQNPDELITVYRTQKGNKYHDANCSTLGKNKVALTLAQAKADGLTPHTCIH